MNAASVYESVQCILQLRAIAKSCLLLVGDEKLTSTTDQQWRLISEMNIIPGKRLDVLFVLTPSQGFLSCNAGSTWYFTMCSLC